VLVNGQLRARHGKKEGWRCGREEIKIGTVIEVEREKDKIKQKKRRNKPLERNYESTIYTCL
jgi:hypothetical protein